MYTHTHAGHGGHTNAISPAQEPVEPRTVRHAITRLEASVETVRNLVARASALADFLEPAPNGAGISPNAPSPSGMVGQLQVQQDQLSEALAALSGELGRIERAIG